MPLQNGLINMDLARHGVTTMDPTQLPQRLQSASNSNSRPRMIEPASGSKENTVVSPLNRFKRLKETQITVQTRPCSASNQLRKILAQTKMPQSRPILDPCSPKSAMFNSSGQAGVHKTFQALSKSISANNHTGQDRLPHRTQARDFALVAH